MIAKKAGVLAWAGIALYVVIYDVLAMTTGLSTLSSSFHRGSQHKTGRWALLAFWLYLTGHLFRWIPAKLDLFRNLDKPIPSKRLDRYKRYQYSGI